MRYSKWSDESDWYIYWMAGNKKTDQPILSINHVTNEYMYSTTYSRLKEAKGDYSFIQKFKGNQEELCIDWIDHFILDVEWDLVRAAFGDLESLLIDDWRPEWFGTRDFFKHISEKTIKLMNDHHRFIIKDGRPVGIR